MRTIKFRAWDGRVEQMIEVYKMVLNPDGWSVNYLPVDDRIIFMQFTGLKDKNGKEIYERDVVKRWIGMKEFFYEIKWYQESYVMWDKKENWLPLMLYGTIPHSDFLDGLGLLEVVGNFYENPELLKGE